MLKLVDGVSVNGKTFPADCLTITQDFLASDIPVFDAMEKAIYTLKAKYYYQYSLNDLTLFVQDIFSGIQPSVVPIYIEER